MSATEVQENTCDRVNNSVRHQDAGAFNFKFPETVRRSDPISLQKGTASSSNIFST
jgi:hypothetical protein